MDTGMNAATADLHELTGHFGRWQGLRWLPTALGALLAAALLAPATSGDALSTAAFGAAVAIVVTDRWIDGLYHRRYGQVRDLPSRRRTLTVARYVAVVLAVLVISADLRWRPPVLISGWVIAAAMVAFWWLSGRGRRLWPVLAVLPAVATLAPLVPTIGAGRPAIAVLLAATGVAELAGGVFDHLMLLRRLREVRDGLRG